MLKLKSCFPLKIKVFLLIFECLPPFISPFVLPTLSHFPFSLSLSLYLSLFLVIFLFSSFLVCFLVCFLVFCFFLSCLVSLLLSHANKNIKLFHLKGSSHQCLFFLLLSCFCLVFEIPFCYLCFLPWPQPLLGVIFSLVFVVVFLFCVGFVFVAFVFSLLKMSEKKRESYPTSQLTARPLKSLFQKCLFVSTNFLIHKEGVLEVSSQNLIFAVFLLNFIHVFWEMLRQHWELPH